MATKHSTCSRLAGAEGMLMAGAPLLFLLAYLGVTTLSPPLWRIIVAGAAMLLCFICGLCLSRHLVFGKATGLAAAIGAFAAAFPPLSRDPLAALAGLTCFLFACMALLGTSADRKGQRQATNLRLRRTRAFGASLCAPVAIILIMLVRSAPAPVSLALMAITLFACYSLLLYHLAAVRSWWRIVLAFLGVLSTLLTLSSSTVANTAILALLLSLLPVLLMPSHTEAMEQEENWWAIVSAHPGRILLTTFFALCLLGTLLLSLPIATRSGSIHTIDAAFTAVSAVCVTGLTVLDTGSYFTETGQVFILLLIQLGGLGIMGIATVALHVIGRRISLKHERILTSITDSNHQDLISSIITILKFTFIVEGFGGLMLSFLFFQAGDQPYQALWRGFFTAISAFCNAGFGLQSDSLIPYQYNAPILHTVALLIIAGGLAPAACLAIPKWVRGKNTPIVSHLSLTTTAILLIIGTVLVLAAEWGGILRGMSFMTKIHNAWFQSVTLRTAGFNSLDLTNMTDVNLLISIIFMFIGGSPGGTAGGVKTTTVALLAMTFSANVTGRTQIVVQKRRIHPFEVYRAIAVVVAGMAILFLAIITLRATQDISTRSLIFEATSAIGTVGLTIGATPLLDEIGKIIIMLTMFAGRIGPVTLFMLLNDDQTSSDTRYPVERISIT